PWQGGGKAITDPGLRPGHPLRDGMAREIKGWQFERETLSTSPHITYSTVRPLKATLDDLMAAGTSPSDAFWSEIEGAMRNLSADLRGTPRGDLEAKAGRVLNADNESDLREALKLLEQAMARASAVIGRQPDYSPKEQPTTEEHRPGPSAGEGRTSVSLPAGVSTCPNSSSGRASYPP